MLRRIGGENVKAWSVLEQYEHTGVIVFAETVSEAKTVARGVD